MAKSQLLGLKREASEGRQGVLGEYTCGIVRARRGGSQREGFRMTLDAVGLSSTRHSSEQTIALWDEEREGESSDLSVL